MTDGIKVAVDADVAQAYRAVSERDRQNLDLLVSLRLRDATMTSEIRHAQERGLTPKTLWLKETEKC